MTHDPSGVFDMFLSLHLVISLLEFCIKEIFIYKNVQQNMKYERIMENENSNFQQ